MSLEDELSMSSNELTSGVRREQTARSSGSASSATGPLPDGTAASRLKLQSASKLKLLLAFGSTRVNPESSDTGSNTPRKSLYTEAVALSEVRYSSGELQEMGCW